MKEIMKSSEYRLQLLSLLYFAIVADVIAVLTMLLLEIDMQIGIVSLFVGNIYMVLNFTWLYHSADKASRMEISQGLYYMARKGRLRFLATALYLVICYLLFSLHPLYLAIPLLYFKYMNYFNAIRRK